jgi:NADPH:quinone reductase-like Zn-dependent oxidoreductase
LDTAEALMRYKRVVITQPGGADTLQVREEDELPQPGAGEARIRVLAAGVARADILMRRGRYPGEVPSYPYTPGYDIVGWIDTINGANEEMAAGQKVAALTKVGGYSEYICLPVKDLVRVPDSLDPAEAVALVLNYLTAYQMLHRYARVKPEQRVLIHAAASGVGTALLQLGQLSDLEMYGTASGSKLGVLRQLGATPIDYTVDDFRKAVRRETGNGVDAAFDPIGGSHLWKSYRTLSASGNLIAYGELSTSGTDHPAWIDVWMHHALPILLRRIPGGRSVRWFEVYPVNHNHPDWYHQDLTNLINLLAVGTIKPIIAARLPLVEAGRAHEMLESRTVIGKIVLLDKDD